MGNATAPEALGRNFGATLTKAEVRWLMSQEYAAHATDVMWRRSKLGLRMMGEEVEALERWRAGCGRLGAYDSERSSLNMPKTRLVSPQGSTAAARLLHRRAWH